MSTIRFDDGISFDTSGPLRLERRRDGLYVVGRNMMFAVETIEEGRAEIAALALPAAARIPFEPAAGDPQLDRIAVESKSDIAE